MPSVAVGWSAPAAAPSFSVLVRMGAIVAESTL